mgnify:CR=1 FL=1
MTASICSGYLRCVHFHFTMHIAEKKELLVEERKKKDMKKWNHLLKVLTYFTNYEITNYLANSLTGGRCTLPSVYSCDEENGKKCEM